MNITQQFELIKRGAVEIISEEGLLKKLEKSIATNRPLKVKAGFDPSAPDIHLGHAVLLRKLRHFQDAGHIVYFLIGDFTGRIGDPSGQSVIRRQLTKAEVLQNARTYERQVFKVLDRSRTNVVFNSQWFDRMSLPDILRLTAHSTVAQMLARADFKERFEKQVDISILEFMYPLLQAYDSVKLEADVEVGGTDQKFNLLKGRDLQKDFQQEEQVVMLMPLLLGTDGINKMSKSLDNYIGINEEPGEMFGKVMSISDDLMLNYYELLTDIRLSEIERMKADIKDGSLHPKQAKLDLAGLVVEQYHSKAAAEEAKEEFESIFKEKNLPKDMPIFKVPDSKLKDGKIWIVELMQLAGLARSGSEVRRLIQQGGVTINNTKCYDINLQLKIEGEIIIKAGKRMFVKIIKS